jgi:hypothetical protein
VRFEIKAAMRTWNKSGTSNFCGLAPLRENLSPILKAKNSKKIKIFLLRKYTAQ